MDLTTLLNGLSAIIYVLFLVASFFKNGPVVKILFGNTKEAKDFFFRVFVGIIFLPIMGVLFNLLGYLGKFLLLPFKFLQF